MATVSHVSRQATIQQLRQQMLERFPTATTTKPASLKPNSGEQETEISEVTIDHSGRHRRKNVGPSRHL